MKDKTKATHFWDVGSNTGQTFDWYLLKTDEYDGMHVWCFEPSPRNLGPLRERCAEIVADNTHNFKITICPFALAAKTKWGRLFEKADSLGDSLFETTYVGDVEIFNIDTPLSIICAEVNVIDFLLFAVPEGDKAVLKIDCEGAEYEILGAIMASKEAQSRIEKILIEFHGLGRAETHLRLKLYHEFVDSGIPFEEWKL